MPSKIDEESKNFYFEINLHKQVIGKIILSSETKEEIMAMSKLLNKLFGSPQSTQ